MSDFIRPKCTAYLFAVQLLGLFYSFSANRGFRLFVCEFPVLSLFLHVRVRV